MIHNLYPDMKYRGMSFDEIRGKHPDAPIRAGAVVAYYAVGEAGQPGETVSVVETYLSDDMNDAIFGQMVSDIDLNVDVEGDVTPFRSRSRSRFWWLRGMTERSVILAFVWLLTMVALMMPLWLGAHEEVDGAGIGIRLLHGLSFGSIMAAIHWLLVRYGR